MMRTSISYPINNSTFCRFAEGIPQYEGAKASVDESAHEGVDEDSDDASGGVNAGVEEGDQEGAEEGQ